MGGLESSAADFYKKHKFYAGQQKFACATCHSDLSVPIAMRTRGDQAQRQVQEFPERMLPIAGIISAGTKLREGSIRLPAYPVMDERTTKGVEHVIAKKALGGAILGVFAFLLFVGGMRGYQS